MPKQDVPRKALLTITHSLDDEKLLIPFPVENTANELLAEVQRRLDDLDTSKLEIVRMGSADGPRVFGDDVIKDLVSESSTFYVGQVGPASRRGNFCQEAASTPLPGSTMPGGISTTATTVDFAKESTPDLQEIMSMLNGKMMRRCPKSKKKRQRERRYYAEKAWQDSRVELEAVWQPGHEQIGQMCRHQLNSQLMIRYGGEQYNSRGEYIVEH